MFATRPLVPGDERRGFLVEFDTVPASGLVVHFTDHGWERLGQRCISPAECCEVLVLGDSIPSTHGRGVRRYVHRPDGRPILVVVATACKSGWIVVTASKLAPNRKERMRRRQRDRKSAHGGT